MSSNNDNQARLHSFEYVYISYEVQPFDIDEYFQNPAMIKKLHEEMRLARAVSTSLQDKLEIVKEDYRRLELQTGEVTYKLNEAKKEVSRLLEDKQASLAEIAILKTLTEQTKDNHHQIEIQKAEIEIELRTLKEYVDKSKRASLLEYVTSLLAAIMLGFGVNVITSSPSDWKGWVIVIASVFVAVIAYFIHERGLGG